jgi:phosphatidylglycerophosphate synthase
MVGWSNQITDWWYGKTFAGIALFVLAFQMVNLIHHWIVIYLKLRIYQITVFYLKAAEKEQIETFAAMTQMKAAMEMVKAWAELARIQTSNVRLVNDEVRRTASDVAEHLETKIDQVPDRVVEKIQTTDGNGSSIVKAVTDTPPVE